MEKGPNLYEKKINAKVYFIIGYLLLLAMALCWSLDNSIVLILFGGAVYFLFLGFYTSARRNISDGGKKTENFRGHASSASFADVLKKVFSKYNSRFEKSFTQSKVSSSLGPSAPLVILAIFVGFFIFLVGSIFNSSGNDFESADYFSRAEEQYSQGAYDSAYVNYRRTWKADESNAQAMLGYGNVLAYRQQYDSAAAMYDKAFATNPAYLDAPYAKGVMFYNTERYNDAIALMDPLLKENTDYYNGMLLIGDCYYALTQFDNAIIWYANAYENGGMRSSALCHLMAYIYDTRGDYDKAVKLYQEALEYDSTMADIYKRLGELLPNEDGNYYRTQAVRLGQQQ